MKAIFVAYNQAYGEEIVAVLDRFGQRGFTRWNDIAGRGGVDGEPHMGSHAWPVMNCAILTMVPDEMAQPLMDALRATDEASPDLGLRAYCWGVEAAV